MATLKQLYQLVHALDKAEKKHVSMLVDALGGKARTRYANALRVINELKEFDADKLKKKLSAGVSGMSLTEANDYIFTFVCKALVSHTAPATGNLGLLKEMILVELMISKGLFDIADKLLHPLLDKLKNGNSFGLLIRGQELKSIITASCRQNTVDYAARIAVVDERTETATQHLQYLEIMRMNNQLYELAHRLGEPRDKTHLQQYKAIFKHPIWKTPYSKVSNQVFIMYGPLRIDMINMVHGSDAAIAEGKIALREFKSRFNVNDHYVLYFYLLDSTISDCIRSQDERTMLPLLNELRALLPFVKQHAVAQKIQAKLMYAELILFVFHKDYAAGVTRLEEWMKPECMKLWQEAPLAYANLLLGARLHYLNRSPEMALDFLQLMQPEEKGFRASILLAYRFLHLMCYYRLNNPSLVFSTANSIYKSLLKQEKLYAPERAILRFAKSSGTVERMKRNIRELHHALHTLSQDRLHQSFFQFADYLEWTETELKEKR